MIIIVIIAFSNTFLKRKKRPGRISGVNVAFVLGRGWCYVSIHPLTDSDQDVVLQPHYLKINNLQKRKTTPFQQTEGSKNVQSLWK